VADDLLDIARGDQRLADMLRKHLAQLADNGNDKLREMARSVLNDGHPLRDLALSATYGDELGAAFDTFWTKYQSMSPDEQTELQDLGRSHVDSAM
jgi:hypothetical protein